jgi:hypothetical protein
VRRHIFINLGQSQFFEITTLDDTYRRFPCSRSAIGAEGSWMVSHAFGTLTSRIALRVTFFKVDLEPRVATSL